jgi:hypothetical protein
MLNLAGWPENQCLSIDVRSAFFKSRLCGTTLSGLPASVLIQRAEACYNSQRNHPRLLKESLTDVTQGYE